MINLVDTVRKDGRIFESSREDTMLIEVGGTGRERRVRTNAGGDYVCVRVRSFGLVFAAFVLSIATCY